MTALDRLLQRWRLEKTRPFLRPGDRVLDIGSADGALFHRFPWLGEGVGVDPELQPERLPRHVRAVRGTFPGSLPEQESFDALTLLAVLEHVPEPEQAAFAQACTRALRPGGHLLVTVPSPRVDGVLHVLMALRLLSGMEVGQHYGFRPEKTVPLFEHAGLGCVRHERFQLGLNHFFAFRKP